MTMTHYQPDPKWMTLGDEDDDSSWEDDGLYEPDEEEC